MSINPLAALYYVAVMDDETKSALRTTPNAPLPAPIIPPPFPSVTFRPCKKQHLLQAYQNLRDKLNFVVGLSEFVTKLFMRFVVTSCLSLHWKVGRDTLR
jgi:hypothetical protein